jgi:hypothetical protein
VPTELGNQIFFFSLQLVIIYFLTHKYIQSVCKLEALLMWSLSVVRYSNMYNQAAEAAPHLKDMFSNQDMGGGWGYMKWESKNKQTRCRSFLWKGGGFMAHNHNKWSHTIVSQE